MGLPKLDFNLVHINLSNLKHNFKVLQQFAQKRPLMAVVKGDAYGHGLLECAKALEKAGVNALGVLDISEGLLLRENGIRVPIHLLAGLEGSAQIKAAIIAGFSIFAHSPTQLLALSKAAKNLKTTANIHLKVDTGMGRLGLPTSIVPEILKKLTQKPEFRLLGLATHLATNGDQEAKKQLEHFQLLTEFYKKLGLSGQHSALNSAGILAHQNYDDGLSRPGLALYGHCPLSPLALSKNPKAKALIQNLRPVMEVKSRVIQIRKVSKGETISYDRTFTASNDMLVGAVPFGYVHGLSRIRSGQGHILIGGQKAPLLGRICMNQSLYDLSHIPGAKEGDEAVIVGRQNLAEISATEAAQWQQSISYEILCLMGRLNPRKFS